MAKIRVSLVLLAIPAGIPLKIVPQDLDILRDSLRCGSPFRYGRDQLQQFKRNLPIVGGVAEFDLRGEYLLGDVVMYGFSCGIARGQQQIHDLQNRRRLSEQSPTYPVCMFFVRLRIGLGVLEQ